MVDGKTKKAAKTFENTGFLTSAWSLNFKLVALSSTQYSTW